MNARRLILAILCTVSGVLVFSGAPALAMLTHPYTGHSLGSGGLDLGTFSNLQGVAVEQSTGDVYVFDADAKSGTGAIYRFNSAGEPASFSALGTNVIKHVSVGAQSGVNEIAVSSAGPTAGDIYLASFGANVRIYGSDGRPVEVAGQPAELKETAGAPWGTSCGVAVDPAGNVYVGLYAGFVNKYTPTGNPVTNGNYVSSLWKLASPCNVAADAEENVYIDTSPGGPVRRYGKSQFSPVEPLLPTEGPEIDVRGSTLAVDPSSHDVYIDEQNDVAEYESAGTAKLLGVSGVGGPGGLSGSLGVAVNHSSGEIYAGNASGVVKIYGGSPVVVAEVATQAASDVTQTAAALNGAVNPAGLAVSACQFEYRAEGEASFGAHTMSCSPAPGSGEALVSVSANVTGLALGTSYVYRLVVVDAHGASYGHEETFTTPLAVQGVSTGSPEEVTLSTAKLTGSLSPDGTDARYYFQYGRSTSYGSMSPPLPGVDAGSGGVGCVPPGGPSCSVVSAETTLVGLTANTTYHYRLLAVDKYGTSEGQDGTFTTSGPPRIISESAEVQIENKAGQTNATLQAQVNPDGGHKPTTYRFEYGETQSYGTSTPVPDGELGEGKEPVSVPEAVLAGLKIGTTYHYRVTVTNEYGTINGPDQQFTTLAAVSIEEFATEVTATSATLNARLNPLGNDTHYYFQYGTSPSYGASVPAPPGADIGSGEANQSASPLHLQNLAPGVTYHYRVVAESMLGTVDAADATITPQGASLVEASEDGSKIAYVANAPIGAEPQGLATGSQSISTRDLSGWSSRDISIPHATPTIRDSSYHFFSSDLSLGVTEPGDVSLVLSPEVSERTVYLHQFIAGGYRPLVTAANVPPGTKFGGNPNNLAGEISFMGATPNLDHVVLYSGVALTSTPSNGGLYEWVGGQLQLVSVLPSGGPAGTANSPPVLGSYLNVGSGVGSGLNVRHAISSSVGQDGSRVAWSSGGSLYLRDMNRGETVQLDAGGPGEALFQAASEDGSKVFFTDTQQLTPDSNAEAGKPDLYECGIVEVGGKLACKLVDLTKDTNAGESAAVRGTVLGVSEDGSYVYFVANGVLASGAAPGGCLNDNEGEAAAGATCNLYVEHYDGTKWGKPTFLAALSNLDGPDWGGPIQGVHGVSSEGLTKVTSRVSPNGRYLAFMSQRSLTGYDNRDANSGEPDEEVFLYDANANREGCMSCDPTAARPVGELATGGFPGLLVDPEGVWRNHWLAGSIPGWSSDSFTARYQPRYLSDSGRVFFNSPDALVPKDGNGQEDVYEYEPQGVGGCQRASGSSGGCVGLISSGASGEESAFFDASTSGDDVFFLTSSRLAPQDTDTEYDVYDAHVCSTSVPCVSSPVSPPACGTSDSCKAAPLSQPAIFGPSGSATFSGAGNVVSRKVATPRAKPPMRTQQLAKALKACKRKSKRWRPACERQARKSYGAKKTNANKKGNR